MCLEKLENCEVKLLDVSDSLLVDWVNNSKVFIGPTQESIFIRSCENTTFTIATKQLRTRDCKNCTLLVLQDRADRGKNYWVHLSRFQREIQRYVSELNPRLLPWRFPSYIQMSLYLT